MSAHVTSRMFTFPFKGLFNSFSLTILHVLHGTQPPAASDLVLPARAQSARLCPGECWAGEGICDL